ncbi:hypothetical protein ACFQMA_15145 [Halosimplex aquaticum]|uniref:Holin n=1 Tax=Halosimplex aquaticum TaxID=3026162 RepID=A0ABD5YA26_9EURY|nr:hypothetical protein [Halosimplex aquaticum]
MSGIFAALEPAKVALAVIAVLGIAPVVIQYRDRSKWFAVGYGLLVAATLFTNLESLFLGGLLNLAEHAIGLMGAGIAFLVAALVHRRRLREEGVLDDG